MTDANVRDEVKAEPISPNVALAIAPNGYIRCVFGYDLITTSFYCDGNAARTLSQHFAEAADEFDRVWAQINNPELLAQPQIELFRDEDAIPDEAIEHEETVLDVIAFSESPSEFD